MLSLHPAQPVLEGYWRDELPHPRRRKIAKHVSGCPVCQRRIGQLEKEAQKVIPIEYDGAFRRAVEMAKSLQRGVDEEARRSALLLSELLGQPSGGRLDLVLHDPRFHALKLCQLLQDRSRTVWFRKPTESLEPARLAAAIADHLDEGLYGSNLVAETRARTWALLGNAYRLSCDLRSAEQALQRAVEHQRLATDPSVENEVLGFMASLRKAQGRSEECLTLLGRVLTISREAGNLLQKGRALTLKATVLGESGRLQDALRLLRKVMLRIDSAGAPELSLVARYNFLTFLAEWGRPQEAQKLLEQERQLYLELDKHLSLTRLHWLEGLINDGLGRLEMAAVHLMKAREVFMEQQMSRDWALVSLHLALVLSKQGRPREGKRLIEEVIPVFDFLNIQPEAFAARVVYRRLQ